MDLFQYMNEVKKEKESPLASRLRPTTLEEVVGQQHIIGKDKLLYRAIKADKISSVIFYGPPGTGKTTLAKVIANTTSAEFTQINATSAGKKDMEEVIQGAISLYYNALKGFSMKKIILLTIGCLLLLLLTSCSAESGDLLYSVDYDDLTYCVRGSDTQAEQIVVKKGDEVLWYKNVDVEEDIGNYRETYGFFAEDLNFDGHRDLAIATDVSGDCYTYLCYLYNPTTEDYEKSDELSSLYNVKADAKLKAVFGFTHTQSAENPDSPARTLTADTATMYEWENGVLVPLMKASLTHYSDTDLYLYSVAYYNPETGKYEDDYGKEAWMTPEEYNAADKSVVFYFK